jgi:transposase-like protein
VEDITESLWGARVSPSTVSELNQKIYAKIEAWGNRPIEGSNAYVYLDGIWLKEVAAMLKAINAQEDREAATEKAKAVRSKLESMRLPRAAQIVAEGVHETLAYMAFPREHWSRIRTNNMLERVMREIRRRTRVVGNFPDGTLHARPPHVRRRRGG